MPGHIVTASADVAFCLEPPDPENLSMKTLVDRGPGHDALQEHAKMPDDIWEAHETLGGGELLLLSRRTSTMASTGRR